MQPTEVLQGGSIETLEQEFLFANDPDTTDAERIQGIIESKYCRADPNKIVEEFSHLERAEQKQLLRLLQNFKISLMAHSEVGKQIQFNWN